MKYISPQVFEGSFTCPHCGAISQQKWWAIGWDGTRYGTKGRDVLRVGTCTHCEQSTFWINDQMESFFHTIKAEWIRGRSFESFEHLESELVNT